MGLFDIMGGSKSKEDRIKQMMKDALKCFDKEDYKNAMICVNEILNLDPNHFNALFLMGLIAIQMNEYEAAKPALEKAREVVPNDKRKAFELLTNLAIVYLELGNAKSWAQCVSRMRELDPNSESTDILYAQMYARQKNYAKAVEYCDAALKKAPGSKAAKVLKEAYTKKIEK